MRRSSWSAAAVAVALTLLLGACALAPVDLSNQRPLQLRSTIEASDGTVLARFYKQNRVYVPIQRMPQSLIDAVVAAEDARYFEHNGFDFRAMARAALANIRSGRVVQGGSTITQQYVKNTYFREPGRTFERKARELRLAVELERRYSKWEILERYLNTVYFGEGAYGVKVAAQTYFDHGLGTLSLPEAALLAALIRAPTAYHPRLHPEQAKSRRDYVLARMAQMGAVSAGRAAAAATSELGVSRRGRTMAYREPFFVEAVRQEILGDPRLGSTPDERDRLLHEGGLRVETTLQPRLQAAAEGAVSAHLSEPGDPEAAIVAIRPRTGRIVAMVGGRDYAASQVNLALGVSGGGSGRQPGSSFKPIVTAAALESGISLAERFESSPATFTLESGETWTVHNAEGEGYGLMPLDEALVHSVNGVFARLGLQLGAGPVTTLARLMGVTAKLAPVPSVVLGADEVSVLDMAAAYATLANRGTALTPTAVKRIRLPGGEVLGPRQEVRPRVISPGSAYLVTKVLEQVIARGTGSAADIGRPAAGKTGTTNDYADAWFVGYTPQLVAAVWVGYPHGRVPMTSVHGIRVSGGTFPAMIWRTFMTTALEGAPVEDFSAPRSEYVTVEIDPATGLRAAPWCPGEPRTMLAQLVPTEYCPTPPPPEPSPTATPSPTPTATPGPGKEAEGGGTGQEDKGKEDKGKEDGPPQGGQATPTPSPSPSATQKPR
jgi:penicillin-binding protein 1A